VRAIRATLETWGERLYGGEAKDLAAQLPQEIGTYLTMQPVDPTFGVREFSDRVAEREGVDLAEATYHARAVIEIVQEAVTPGEIDDVMDQQFPFGIVCSPSTLARAANPRKDKPPPFRLPRAKPDRTKRHHGALQGSARRCAA